MVGSIEEAEDWMRMAEQALLAARALQEKGFFRDSVSRSYYAIFYAARATLALQDIHVHKHSAVIAAFGRLLANAGLVPRRLHRLLIAAFKDRGGADYEPGWKPTRERAETRIGEAEEFVAEIRSYLGRRGTD